MDAIRIFLAENAIAVLAVPCAALSAYFFARAAGIFLAPHLERRRGRARARRKLPRTEDER